MLHTLEYFCCQFGLKCIHHPVEGLLFRFCPTDGIAGVRSQVT